jgi:uncharacterized membrane protein YfcA
MVIGGTGLVRECRPSQLFPAVSSALASPAPASSSWASMEFALWIYVALFAAGLLAGWVDAIAGGGGLIALPVLLTLGLPVPVALGTNKFQSACGTLFAVRHYARSGLIDFRACGLGIAATLVGALLGTFTVQRIDPALLGRLVPWLLAGILLYTIFRPAAGAADQPPRMPARAFFLGFGLLLGFYDGFFGPGAGSFWAIAFVLLLGQNFARATAHTKVMNVTSNLASLALFASAGMVHWIAGLTMAAGQIVGASLGSRLVVSRGARFVRPVFLVVVSLTLARLIYLNYR